MNAPRTIPAGPMGLDDILPLIRGKFSQVMNGYLRVPQMNRELDAFIVSPGLKGRSGILGALALGGYVVKKSA